ARPRLMSFESLRIVRSSRARLAPPCAEHKGLPRAARPIELGPIAGVFRTLTFGAAFASAALMAVACGDDKAECSDGAEGCACYATKTCNEGLSCLSNLCVDADDKPGKSKGDGGSDGEPRDGGVDP